MNKDVFDMKNYIFSLMNLTDSCSILDLGCGLGRDLIEISKIAPNLEKYVGIDSREEAINEARKFESQNKKLNFIKADISEKIPLQSETFDIIYSTNMLECIKDKTKFLKEVYRVLKPNGQVVFAHFDWDSQIVNGNNKSLVKKIIDTYNNWQQKWMADIDPWIGRRLWGLFNSMGLWNGNIYTYVLVNTDFKEGLDGYNRIHSFKHLVINGLVKESEYEDFLKDIQELVNKGAYFYSITMYIYIGKKWVNIHEHNL